MKPPEFVLLTRFSFQPWGLDALKLPHGRVNLLGIRVYMHVSGAVRKVLQKLSLAVRGI